MHQSLICLPTKQRTDKTVTERFKQSTREIRKPSIARPTEENEKRERGSDFQDHDQKDSSATMNEALTATMTAPEESHQAFP